MRGGKRHETIENSFESLKNSICTLYRLILFGNAYCARQSDISNYMISRGMMMKLNLHHWVMHRSRTHSRFRNTSVLALFPRFCVFMHKYIGNIVEIASRHWYRIRECISIHRVIKWWPSNIIIITGNIIPLKLSAANTMKTLVKNKILMWNASSYCGLLPHLRHDLMGNSSHF